MACSHPARSRDVVRRREDAQLVDLLHLLAGERVQVVEPLDLVTEELDADGQLLVRRDDLHGVAADPEGAAGEGEIVARVLDVDQRPQQRVPFDRLPDLHRQRAVQIRLRRAQAVDAGHRRDHDDVPAGQQRHGGRVPQPLHVGVDRRVLLDVGVGLRDVGLWLVVVVVRDEVLDRVVREEFSQLVGELRGQRLVRRHDQRGALHLLDQPGGRRRLAGAGGTQQHHVLFPVRQPAAEVLDRLGLVTGWAEVADDLEAPAVARDVADGSMLGDGQHGVFGRECHG